MTRKFNIIVYRNSKGACPYADWFDALKDERGRTRVIATLAKVRAGNTGPLKRIKGYDDLSEIRVFGKGPGYRLYCLQDGQSLIILLGAGAKDTQHRFPGQRERLRWTR